MRFLHLRRLLQLLCLVLTVFGANNAMARYNDCTGSLPATLNIPNVSVPSNLPVGQVVPGAVSSLSVTITCAAASVPADSFWSVLVNSSVTLVPGFTDVYTVAAMHAGVGFRIRANDGTPAIATGNSFNVASATNGANSVNFSVELVRTASTIVAGSVNFNASLTVSGFEWANGGTGPLSQINFAYSMPATTVAACSVTETDTAVTLPTIGARSLTTTGAISGGAAFGLRLNCESGAKPRISMTDATTPSNQSTVLSLAPGSSAAGVGVQILYGATPVMFAPASSYSVGGVSTSNMIDLGARSGVINVPFQANYVRNSSTLTPGTVKALATFTLAYQ